MSGELNGEALDVRAIRDGGGAESGIQNGAELVAFSDACVDGDPAAVAEARRRLEAVAGPEPVVEAAATIGNFERMVRIADGTGIPLDGMMRTLSHGLEEELDLVAFGSAANSPERGALTRIGQRVLGTLLHGGLRLASRFRSR